VKPSPLARDPHALYEAAVQGVDYDLNFAERLFRHLRGRPARSLRDDFCATAALATAFALRDPANVGYGVDLDPHALDWARRHRLARLDPSVVSRVRLVEGDVRTARVPKVDLLLAYNFSYWVFKTRDELRGYFRAARRGLKPDGVFVVNAFGGTDAMKPMVERRRIPAKQAPDGWALPRFRYVWEQESFNPIDHAFRCAIHFEFDRGRAMRRAFTYDWRFWTLPEIRELMAEAGFPETRVYVEAWDDETKPDPPSARRATMDQQETWLALVAGIV
jgi:SAM-dependent methyltransferase